MLKMLVAVVIEFGVAVVYSKGHVGWLVSVSVGDLLGLVRGLVVLEFVAVVVCRCVRSLGGCVCCCVLCCVRWCCCLFLFLLLCEVFVPWMLFLRSCRRCSSIVGMTSVVCVLASFSLKIFTACLTVGIVISAQLSRLPAVSSSFSSKDFGKMLFRSAADIRSLWRYIARIFALARRRRCFVSLFSSFAWVV